MTKYIIIPDLQLNSLERIYWERHMANGFLYSEECYALFKKRFYSKVIKMTDEKNDTQSILFVYDILLVKEKEEHGHGDVQVKLLNLETKEKRIWKGIQTDPILDLMCMVPTKENKVSSMRMFCCFEIMV